MTRHTPLHPYARAALVLIGGFWGTVLLLAAAVVILCRT
ncbi:hypothetical protein BZZ08_01697 [Streptomyces sp. MH60]|nr:hypothetical protein BZZ08_01697 [Streptomyces sp. MH60]